MSRQIEELHQKIIELQKMFGEYLGQMGRNWKQEKNEVCVRPLENEEIRSTLINSFLTAKESLSIISPWISNWVLNPYMDAIIKGALKRGVSIKILYGIGNLEGSNTNKESDKKRNDSTNKFAQQLKNRYRSYGERFSMQTKVIGGEDYDDFE